MSGIPAPERRAAAHQQRRRWRATRDLGNELGASQRMLTQGMLTPNFPPGNDTGTNISDMEWLVKELGIRALKTYTGAGYGVFGAPDIAPWWLDDEQVTYPMLEEAQRLGINIVNTHKGLRLGIFDPEYIHPRDVPKAARDWPKINFVHLPLGRRVPRRSGRPQAQRDPRRDQRLLRARRDLRRRGAPTTRSSAVGHLLGKLINAASAPTTSSGAPTRSGTARRSGRSTR